MDPLIRLNEFQRTAGRTDQNQLKGLEGLAFPLLGLFGEVGTLLSALKKKQRDQRSFIGYTDAIIEEFGDVLWYFSNIASRASLDLSIIAQSTSRANSDWDEVQVDELGSFADLQMVQTGASITDTGTFEASLIALAGRVGHLMNDFQANRIGNNRDVILAHLVDIFRGIIHAAELAHISLAEAATSNIRKIQSRWPEVRTYAPLFDANFDRLEQLPRKIEMHIFEQRRGNRTYVFLQCNGINIGSALTDNRVPSDDYRFHDVFHLAYASILGWSPVIRALLNLKRKSDPITDETQDGARAILVEEGISSLIFNRASNLNHFAEIETLDYSLLKLIPELVNGYEAENCPLWQWEKAILDGYSVFRLLRKYRRGIVRADLNDHTISFEQLVK